MAAKSGQASPKNSVPMPIIIVSAVVLLVIISWFAYTNLIAPSPDKETSASNANDQWLDRITKASGGDDTKLNPDDLAKLNAQTRGHAHEMLQGRAKKLGIVK